MKNLTLIQKIVLLFSATILILLISNSVVNYISFKSELKEVVKLSAKNILDSNSSKKSKLYKI